MKADEPMARKRRADDGLRTDRDGLRTDRDEPMTRRDGPERAVIGRY